MLTDHIKIEKKSKSQEFSIRDQVMNMVVQKIRDNTWPPGSRLPVEAELVDLMAISRTALREAVRTLAALGILKSNKKAGTVVQPFENWNVLDASVLRWMRNEDGLPTDVLRQIIEARLAFEPVAAELAAKRASKTQLKRIHDTFEGMVRAPKNARKLWVDADLEFHLAILAASGNVFLMRLGDALSHALEEIFVRSSAKREDYRSVLAEHKAVLDAINAGDSVLARSLMLGLIKRSQSDLKLGRGL